MSATVKNLHITFNPCKIVSDVAVAVGIDVGGDCDHFVLESLMHGSPLYSTNSLDSTALLYTMFEVIRAHLLAPENIRGKVSTVECGVQGSEFVISFHCAGNGSAIRKALGAVVKRLVPAKMYPGYSANIKQLSAICGKREIRPDRDAFDAAASAIGKGIAKGINVVVVGKARLDGAKLKDIAEKAQAKYAPTVSPAGKKRNIAVELGENPYNSIKCPGLEGVMAKLYIDMKLKINTHLSSGKLYFTVKPEAVKKHGDKDRIDAFVKKVLKNKDEATCTALYIAASSCLLSTDALNKSASKSLAGLTGAIADILK